MIKVSIIHPSLWRPKQAFSAYQEWMEAADKPKEVEYIISLDDNDPSIEEYQALFSGDTKFGRVVVDVGDSRNSNMAVNRAATILSATSELIVVVAEDMATIPQWDRELLALLEGVDNFTEPKFIGVSDGLQRYGVPFVYLMVNRAWHNRLGYMIYPEYDGVYGDTDMGEVARILDCIIEAPQLLFQHRHYSLGMTPFDETYAKMNDPESYKRNWPIYEGRVARNFDL